MSDHGGEAEQHGDNRARLRLADVAKITQAPAETPTEPETRPPLRGESSPGPEDSLGRELPGPIPEVSVEAAEVAARRRAFAELLGEFRRTAVLVPLGEGSGADGERGFLTADFNRIRFILAFSDEQALARYALARGKSAREWAYQSVLGARLLDVAVPAAGVPCGVALDCADGEDGMVFPPVRGIVPDAVAVDRDADEGDGA